MTDDLQVLGEWNLDGAGPNQRRHLIGPPPLQRVSCCSKATELIVELDRIRVASAARESMTVMERVPSDGDQREPRSVVRPSGDLKALVAQQR